MGADTAAHIPALIRATAHSALPDLRCLLHQTTFDVNSPVNRQQDRLIHFAARAQILTVLQVLVEEFHADVNVSNIFGRRPIHETIECKQCVEYLLSKGADPNGFKHGTWVPAMIATNKNLLPVLKVLYKHGALLTPQNKDGWNVLHVASQKCAVPCAQFILEKAPHLVFVQSRNGRTPAHMAAAAPCVEVLELLLEVGRSQADSLGESEMLQLTHIRDAEGLTIFHLACISGSLSCVDICLKRYQSDARATSKAGMQAVHFAAQANRLNILQYLFNIFLCERTSKVERPDNVKHRVQQDFQIPDALAGFTPLHFAAREGHIDVIRWLIDVAGVSKDVEDAHGRRAVDIGEQFLHTR
ncbi:hypothetical protein SpCBS45565_g01634 [Spizellomyces sp. 'palustris']|nr:hypothetical protein SpCBS45565_g01634 [Spizellomyces sp. 'palustris']